MEQKQFPVKLFGVLALALSLGIGACHNNDTVSTEATTDTTSKMSVDTTIKTPMPDSGMTAPSATDTAKKATGMAKPNPAKKGLKGKVSVVAPATSKMKADAAPDASGIYTNVDHIPAFPGGSSGLQKFFDDNVQYPSAAEDAGVEGTVQVSFTVDENGKIVSPQVDGEKEGYGLDDEALRVINKMPAWTPGKVNGKTVKTRFTLPVKFALN